MVENQTSRNLKSFREENGLEFCGEEFSNFCRGGKKERDYKA